MTASIAGFLLRSNNRLETARFYSELGLLTTENQHGGPIHNEVAPLSSECILEIYASSSNLHEDAIMINVSSINEALRVASEFKIHTRSEMKVAGGVNFVYTKDPDGRSLMLIEKI